jgi:hypothetical protein
MTNPTGGPTDVRASTPADDAEIEKIFREDFIEDTTTGRLRFTPKGFAEYGARFANVGIDINQVRDMEAFRYAVRASGRVFFEELLTMVKGHAALETLFRDLLDGKFRAKEPTPSPQSENPESG